MPCNEAFSFCGLRNQKYPDLRPMGYPFDRNSQFGNNQDVTSLMDLSEQLSNTTLGECLIRFTNTIINRN